jgi:hypothetical protein
MMTAGLAARTVGGTSGAGKSAKPSSIRTDPGLAASTLGAASVGPVRIALPVSSSIRTSRIHLGKPLAVDLPHRAGDCRGPACIAAGGLSEIA